MNMGEKSLAFRIITASRPISWINTAYPFGVGYYLLTGSVDWFLILGSLFFLIPYNIVMYGVNDVFDYASDAQNPRKGGIEGALLPPSTHRAVLIICALSSIPFLLGMWWAGPLIASCFLCLLMVDVIAYSAPPLRTKELPVVDSVTSSIHFVGPLVYAILVTESPWSSQLTMVVISFLCWGIAAHAFGAVQDILPDREASLRSIATEFGARHTVRLAIALWVISGFLILVLGSPLAWVALGVLPYIVLATPFINLSDADSARANRGWRKFLWVNYSVGFLLTLFIISRL